MIPWTARPRQRRRSLRCHITVPHLRSLETFSVYDEDITIGPEWEDEHDAMDFLRETVFDHMTRRAKKNLEYDVERFLREEGS